MRNYEDMCNKVSRTYEDLHPTTSVCYEDLTASMLLDIEIDNAFDALIMKEV